MTTLKTDTEIYKITINSLLSSIYEIINNTNDYPEHNNLLERIGVEFSVVLVQQFNLTNKSENLDLLITVSDILTNINLKNTKDLFYETLKDEDEKNVNILYIFEKNNEKITYKLNKPYNLVIKGIIMGIFNIFDVKYEYIKIVPKKEDTIFLIKYI